MIDEAHIIPAGPVSLDKIAIEDPPVFEFIIPLMPEIELGDFKSIRMPYELEPITEDDIEEVIENLKQGYATAVPVERASKKGDLVSIKIKGTVMYNKLKTEIIGLTGFLFSFLKISNDAIIIIAIIRLNTRYDSKKMFVINIKIETRIVKNFKE